MSRAIDNLMEAQKRAMAGRPRVGGFPYLAETLRRAGVTRNLWFLPACQSLFLTNEGPVVIQGTPLTSARWMSHPSITRPSSRHCGPIRRGKARSRNSWRPRGTREWCATMSISRHEL